MSRLDESTLGIRTNAQRPGKYLNAGLLSPERNPGGHGVAGETGVGGGGRSHVASSAHAPYLKGERKSLKDEGCSWRHRMLRARS